MSWLGRAPSPHDVAVVAHRGDPRRAPENTLASFRRAIAGGARAIETDVQLSADGALFLMHDDDLARTTDAAARGLSEATLAEQLSWGELSQLDAGAWFGEAFRGAGVPLLGQLGELLAAHPGVGLDLEIKPPLTHPPAEVLAAVRAELARPRWADLIAAGDLLVTSFDPDVVELALTELPVPVGLILASTPSPEDVADLAEGGVAALVTEQEDVTPEAVAAAHATGVPVAAYTANEPAEWERALAAGVDAICTDEPAALGAYLARR